MNKAQRLSLFFILHH